MVIQISKNSQLSGGCGSHERATTVCDTISDKISVTGWAWRQNKGSLKDRYYINMRLVSALIVVVIWWTDKMFCGHSRGIVRSRCLLFPVQSLLIPDSDMSDLALL